MFRRHRGGKKKGIQRASTRFSVKSSAMFDPRKTLREKFMEYFRDDRDRTHEEREASRKRRERVHISLNPERIRVLPSEEVIQFPQFGTTSLTYLWEIFCKCEETGTILNRILKERHAESFERKPCVLITCLANMFRCNQCLSNLKGNFDTIDPLNHCFECSSSKSTI